MLVAQKTFEWFQFPRHFWTYYHRIYLNPLHPIGWKWKLVSNVPIIFWYSLTPQTWRGNLFKKADHVFALRSIALYQAYQAQRWEAAAAVAVAARGGTAANSSMAARGGGHCTAAQRKRANSSKDLFSPTLHVKAPSVVCIFSLVADTVKVTTQPVPMKQVLTC